LGNRSIIDWPWDAIARLGDRIERVWIVTNGGQLPYFKKWM
jgi:hypothetical protein